jgi:hypothetical protein
MPSDDRECGFCKRPLKEVGKLVISGTTGATICDTCAIESLRVMVAGEGKRTEVSLRSRIFGPGGHAFDSGGRCDCGHTTKDDPKRCTLHGGNDGD